MVTHTSQTPWHDWWLVSWVLLDHKTPLGWAIDLMASWDQPQHTLLIFCVLEVSRRADSWSEVSMVTHTSQTPWHDWWLVSWVLWDHETPLEWVIKLMASAWDQPQRTLLRFCGLEVSRRSDSWSEVSMVTHTSQTPWYDRWLVLLKSSRFPLFGYPCLHCNGRI